MALFFRVEFSSVLCVLLEAIFRMEDNGVLQTSAFKVLVLAGAGAELVSKVFRNLSVQTQVHGRSTFAVSVHNEWGLGTGP